MRRSRQAMAVLRVEGGYPVVVRPLVYRLLWPLGYWVFKLLCRFEVIGKEKIPPSGAVILAPNHRSYIDIPLHFMGKSEIWDRRIGGWISTRFGGFPVRRGLRDRAALATATALLGRGEVVCVFPEGRRLDGPGVGELQAGVAFLAEKTGAPIIPVGIWGADRLLDRRGILHPFRKVLIEIGDPIDVGSEGKLDRRSATAALKESLEALLEDLEARAKGAGRPKAA